MGGFSAPGFGQPGPLAGFGPSFSAGQSSGGASPSDIGSDLSTVRISVLITAIALGIAAGLHAIVLFIQVGRPRLELLWKSVYLFGALVGLAVSITLVIMQLRFAGSISNYRRAPSPKRLENVFSTHLAYWTVWGIVACVVLFLVLVGITMALTNPWMRFR